MEHNKICVVSNILNEIRQCKKGWLDNVWMVADYVLLVDGGSTDGTIEHCREAGAMVVVDNIIQREGYAAARNQLRELVRHHYPDSEWTLLWDPDERISKEDIHQIKVLRDYTNPLVDVIGFPRIDWFDEEMTASNNDIHMRPDYQARMIRLSSPLHFERKLHEQAVGYNNIFCNLSNPKINHFHRSAGQDKRDFVGKVCAKLHNEDHEHGKTYPKHHKEDMYFKKLQEEGL